MRRKAGEYKGFESKINVQKEAAKILCAGTNHRAHALILALKILQDEKPSSPALNQHF